MNIKENTENLEFGEDGIERKYTLIVNNAKAVAAVVDLSVKKVMMPRVDFSDLKLTEGAQVLYRMNYNACLVNFMIRKMGGEYRVNIPSLPVKSKLFLSDNDFSGDVHLYFKKIAILLDENGVFKSVEGDDIWREDLAEFLERLNNYFSAF